MLRWSFLGAVWLTVAGGARAADGMAFFEKEIRPLLVEHCYDCHSTEAGKAKGGLLLDTREALLRGGDNGPAVVVGEPEKSLLVEAVVYENPDMRMPPDGALGEHEVSLLKQWVKAGLPDPREGEAKGGVVKLKTPSLERGLEHWAFQSPREVAVPQALAENPVDAFLRQGLLAVGLDLAPEADRRTLLRRVTFDLTGLPPTPKEMADFLADHRPGAWMRVVERLLASPQYGVRWGRHWLDVARYADSNGLDENLAFGTAWRYRDYVVDSVNADKPFDEFLTEQLAGDLMPSKDLKKRHERMVATAFLNLGAKVLAEPDKEKLVMDVVDEQIDTMGKAFLGMTLGCVRCHDHKFDPITQADYYSLAAIFKSTDAFVPAKKGVISLWKELPLGSFDDFADAISSERDLKQAQAAAKKAEREADEILLAAARPRAVDYLCAALRLKKGGTVTEARRVLESRPAWRDLHAEWVALMRVYIETHPDDVFFDLWREQQEASDVNQAEKKLVAHYAPLFQRALEDPKDSAEEVVAARAALMEKRGPFALPGIRSAMYPAATRARLEELTAAAEQVESDLPDLPTTLGVSDGELVHASLPVHIRGNHRMLGEVVKRDVPRVMQASMRREEGPVFSPENSGRLELARWMTQPDHPLTARVLVNRVWGWHFGQGLVTTRDNFGFLGAEPSHPELLDWMARWLVKNQWSIKALHRLILSSRAWRQQALAAAPEIDPENRLLSGFSPRRLEAEEIRDALLHAAGVLDLTLGGKTVPRRNRQFVFNHTSKDGTGYETVRRSLYLPVIRNHLYEFLAQFDHPDPSMPTGARSASVIAPQALLLLNSPTALRAAEAMAAELSQEFDAGAGDELRVVALFERAMARAPTAAEQADCRDFLREYESVLASTQPDPARRSREAWRALAQTVMMANEFLYLR
ncbi:MAG: PSD1 domain-containing protein [Verrucomicrobiales bacterium]|nr:PSD1 domain-containing protein [Verrucomicrobiales bacterium]